MQYYIIINGSQMGPYSKEELRIQGLSPDSIVWRQGLTDWVPAATLPELIDILADSPKVTEVPAYGPQAYNPPTPPPAPLHQPFNGVNMQPGLVPTPHTNWMPWAIVATIVGFCTSCIGGILGIIAIVNANKANNFYAVGMNEQAAQANSSAKTLTIISIVLDALGIIVSVGYFSYFYPTMLSLVG